METEHTEHDLIAQDDRVRVYATRRGESRSISVVTKHDERAIVHVSTEAFPLGDADKDADLFRQAAVWSVPAGLRDAVVAWLDRPE